MTADIGIHLAFGQPTIVSHSSRMRVSSPSSNSSQVARASVPMHQNLVDATPVLGGAIALALRQRVLNLDLRRRVKRGASSESTATPRSPATGSGSPAASHWNNSELIVVVAAVSIAARIRSHNGPGMANSTVGSISVSCAARRSCAAATGETTVRVGGSSVPAWANAPDLRRGRSP